MTHGCTRCNQEIIVTHFAEDVQWAHLSPSDCRGAEAEAEDIVLQYMLKQGFEITEENYIELNWLGDEPPEPRMSAIELIETPSSDTVH